MPLVGQFVYSQCSIHKLIAFAGLHMCRFIRIVTNGLKMVCEGQIESNDEVECRSNGVAFTAYADGPSINVAACAVVVAVV